jgi:hypothetical protein
VWPFKNKIIELSANDEEDVAKRALPIDFSDYQTLSVYLEAKKNGQRFMGTVLEWLLNTCHNLRRLSISEGGSNNEKFIN